LALDGVTKDRREGTASSMEAANQELAHERRERLRAARRIVVKVGTTTVTGPEGDLRLERLAPIVGSLSALMQEGRQVVLVSSGAVGLGRGWLGLHPSRLKDMVTKQACAAVGQSLLMEAYKRLFGECGVKIAQVLLTEEDFSNWQRYSNLRRTMEKLLGFGILPIVNENDTVSTAELEAVAPGTRGAAFSDNDRLAALVMSGLEADALVLLTNVDGLLRPSEKRTQNDPEASANVSSVIGLVTEITPALKSLASGPSASGRGGMQTKLEAAEIAMNCGGVAVIANGQAPSVLTDIFGGENLGTTFLSRARMRGKRRWIAYAAGVRGSVVVDAGAHHAITARKASLLSSGVLRVDQHFGPMDVVSIRDEQGKEFARGIANCASHEVDKRGNGKPRRGKDSGVNGSHVLFTRDNIVLLKP
jgi:glutamate 5-kinase